MLWSLTHCYHFICTKCNVEMNFLDNFEKPYKGIVFVECSKCKFRFEIKKKEYIEKKKYIERKKFTELIREFQNYLFICTKCNVDMIFLNNYISNNLNNYIRKSHERVVFFECPKCKYQFKIKENRSLIKY